MNTTVSENAISLNIAKSEIGSEMLDTIDARDLHIQLWSKREFATWIKDRLKTYSFEQAGVELWQARNKLFRIARFHKFLKKDNSPYKTYDGEYFTQKVVKHRTSWGKWQRYKQTFVLPKWLELLKQTLA